MRENSRPRWNEPHRSDSNINSRYKSPNNLTEPEEDPDPGTDTPDPTLVNDSAAMTAAQTGQV